MTSVYSVTYVGAHEQIKRRLEEKDLLDDDRLLFTASCYAAKVTLAALGELFQAARGTITWLGPYHLPLPWSIAALGSYFKFFLIRILLTKLSLFQFVSYLIFIGLQSTTLVIIAKKMIK